LHLNPADRHAGRVVNILMAHRHLLMDSGPRLQMDKGLHHHNNNFLINAKVSF
jgi:hypothetical protein